MGVVSEEGLGSKGTVVPMMIMIMMMTCFSLSLSLFIVIYPIPIRNIFNSLNGELIPICHLLALL